MTVMHLKNLIQNLKIKQKLILVFLPIPLLGIVMIGSFWHGSALKAVEDSLKEQTSILAENASLLVEGYLNERTVEVKSVSQLGWIEAFFREANGRKSPPENYQSKMKRLLMDLGGGYFQITCADRNSGLFAKAQLTSFLPSDKIPVHFETRIFNNQDMMGVKESSGASAGEVFISNVRSIRGSKALILSTPVGNDESTKTLGTIAFNIGISKIADEIETQNLGVASQAMILGRGGEVLYHTDRRKVNQNINAVMPFMAHAFDSKLAAKQASTTFRNEHNERWIISAASVKRTGWTIAISSPVKPFTQSTERAGLIGFAATVSVSLLLLSLINRFSKKFVDDISEVTEGARAVASGDLNRQLPVRAGDEIGGLAKDFNKMSADLKRLIKERQANETLIAIGRFSSALAHDLRNPVEGIRLLSSELKKRINATDSAREVADAISQSAANLSVLVNQSLDFARLNKPNVARAELVRVAEEVLSDLQFGEVAFTREYSKSLPKVDVDAIQIRRVLTNLLQNAIEACRRTEQRCQVKLIIRREGAKARIEVVDTGTGIAATAKENIFEPFFSTKASGHGLGLAFVRQIITNHHGNITFTSEPGHGTRFVIELPVPEQ